MRLALSVDEAAEAIGVSSSMLWKLIAAGDIAVVRVGRRTLVRVEELEWFLSDHEGGESAEVTTLSPVTDSVAGAGHDGEG